MIQILPVPQEKLPDFCREHSLRPEPIRAYTAEEGETFLGWCAVGEGEPCIILGLGVEADDPDVADGLLRAALFPLYRRGFQGYRFAVPPGCPLPGRYTIAGTGSLGSLFAPCSEGKEAEE